MSADVSTQRGRHAAKKGTPRGSGVRSDIQGLRAVAVSAVVVYHAWPHALPGGYAGVDIFFVISGFLITSHLLASPPDSARALLEFWSRRIRRLLPAALLVLAVTLGASRVFASSTLWENTAIQVRAAALYVENWRLAHDAVDYLAADNAATPVQHYWSLSVEEQFYLVWPVLMLALFLCARLLRRRPVRFLAVGLGAVVAASLWYSIQETASQPARAYFVTPTRIWELGIGALLAVLVARNAFGRSEVRTPRSRAARTLLVWSGVAAVAVSFAAYSPATAFPGWHALLPTLGCAAVIAANDNRSPGPVGRLLALRPAQRLGDISYSVYLWHWPLIVLAASVDTHVGWLDKTVIIAATLVLAGLTKRYVEDPFRAPRWGRPLLKPYLLGALAMAVVVSGTVVQTHEVQLRAAAGQRQLAEHEKGDDTCFGAAALAAGPQRCPVISHGTLYPEPLAAKSDLPVGFNRSSDEDGCFALMPKFKPVTCTLGTQKPTKRIALVGNSHAYEFRPAIVAVAAEHHWQVTTYIAQRCVYSDVTHAAALVQSTQKTCYDWVHWVTSQLIAHHYDLVVIANRSVVPDGHPVYSPNASEYAQGYRSVLSALQATHRPVLGIRDTPTPGKSIPDCLAAHEDNFATCDGTRDEWLVPDPISEAIADLHDPDITEADLTANICERVRCPAAIGQVPVYFDDSHLSATYARTLAPYLGKALVGAIG